MGKVYSSAKIDALLLLCGVCVAGFSPDSRDRLWNENHVHACGTDLWLNLFQLLINNEYNAR